jgi:ribosome maturation factor RimP
MINKEKIRQVVSDELEGTGTIIIDIHISISNNIKIILDSFIGVNIDECVKINRLIEANFDRDIEDYELEISSYGISQPFILPLHYLKNMNKLIEIHQKKGKIIKGTLKNIELSEDKNDINWIEISNIKKIKEEGKKKKTEVEEIIRLQKGEIQKARLVPVF